MDSGRSLSLDGRWLYRLLDGGEWRPVDVPGCWEAAGLPPMESGPVLYRRDVEVPAGWRGRRLWLRFGGVSYHCRVRVNGLEVGRHTGIWDPFLLEITHAVTAGERIEIEVEVVKPAGLVAGPDSPGLPGSYPLRETLAGFLPYVWGHVFGGIWQSVRLESSAGPQAVGVSARGDATGAYDLQVSFSDPVRAELHVRDEAGSIVARHLGESATIGAQGQIDAPRRWSPDSPHRYQLEVRVAGEVAARRRFGLRSFGRDGTTLILNGAPVYPRMILDWGWYPQALHANPGPARVRADFEKLRTLGFNGVKYCLWVPPDEVLEVADELGMLVWLELPMWLPRTTEAFLEQTPGEYERIVRAVRSHPAIVIYSLGCELSSEVGATLLERLYRQTKALIGDALLRDNSGSGEAYGGLLNEYADYYDYHFYSELPLLRPLLDHFAPRWRPEQPFVFGEFCDSDTFRDLRRSDDHFGGRPWWALDDATHNPQGARWQFDLPWQEERLRANGFWERGAELERVSYRQALLQRKATLELVRSYREIGGYVVTGASDTPISTSGVFDDAGELKFEGAAFRAFNEASVLTLGWDKRRAWVGGGDRAAPWDPYGYRPGERVRPHLILSHYGPERGRVQLAWSVQLPDGTVVAQGEGESPDSFEPGMLRELLVAEFEAPALECPTEASLHASARIGVREVRNRWPLWFFPALDPEALDPIGLHDPEGVLAGLEGVVRIGPRDGAAITLCSEWNDELDARVRGGSSAILLIRGRPDDPIPSVAVPFWREAVKVLEPHPAWGDFPHQGWTDLQFFGIASDRALDTCGLERHEPLLRRLDARTMVLHDYATLVPWGDGRLLITTLRFAGGLGEQPAGVARATCGQELLRSWIGWLEANIESRPPP